MDTFYPILLTYATIIPYHFTALAQGKDISDKDEREEI